MKSYGEVLQVYLVRLRHVYHANKVKLATRKKNVEYKINNVIQLQDYNHYLHFPIPYMIFNSFKIL